MKKRYIFLLAVLFASVSLLANQNPYPKWIEEAVIYHIYPSSFKDSNADGYGDIEGIRSKLDYIRDVGFNTIWISPVFCSAFEDGGYDITDYYNIDPRFGSNSDLDKLVSDAHRKGIRVCLDLVAGHTSDKHPWFVESASGPGGPYADYYIWTKDKAVKPSKPKPNEHGDWVDNDYPRNGYYLKNYYDCQPALNYGYLNPDPESPWEQAYDAPGPRSVRQELKKILAFWFNKGIDGFRCDLAWSLVKGDDAEFHGVRRLWREIFEWQNENYPEALFLSEWSSPVEAISCGFDIDIIRHNGCGYTMYRDLMYNTLRNADPLIGKYPPKDCWFDKAGKGRFDTFVIPFEQMYRATRGKGFPCMPTSSHDTWRMNRNQRNSPEELKTAMTFFLTMPWVPIVYYGEEIGMRSMDGVPAKEGSRDRSAERTPMQWGRGETAGFSECDPSKLYLPVDSSPGRPEVEAELKDPESLLNWTKNLLSFRSEHPALGNTGGWRMLSDPEKPYPVVYERTDSKERFAVILNPRKAPAKAIINVKGKLVPIFGMTDNVKTRRLKGKNVIRIKGISAVICRVDNKGLSPADYVNPFIGTAFVGHTHPSAMLPFGMVQVGPSNLYGPEERVWDYCSGYNDKCDLLAGFSHTHLSGTGCPDMGDIIFLPVSGSPSRYTSRKMFGTRFSHSSETARPGFYSVHLDDYDVDVELTSTTRAGFHKYIFHQCDSAGVLINLDFGSGDTTTHSCLKVIDDKTIMGKRRSKGFIEDHVYYFYSRFSKPIEKIDSLQEGVWLARFPSNMSGEVKVKVGVSHVSCENARKNLDREIPGWNFARTCLQADRIWNKYLSRIEIDPLNPRDPENFYTCLYHALVMPNIITDVDGSYRGWDGKMHKSETGDLYTNFSLWDTYRAEHPLLELLYPEVNSALVRSLLEKYKQTGMLSTNEYGQCETWAMIGNHAVDVIADAYLKGDTSFDPEEAYEAIRHSMTEPHFRSDWDVYDKYGYFPWNGSGKAASARTLEACYDDWCVAQMAQALGKADDYAFFLARADSWKNLFDVQTGFIRPRGTDGLWLKDFNPYALFDPVTKRRDFSEGNSWQWTWHVQHKPEELIEAFGDKAIVVSKLDTLFFSDPGILPGSDQVKYVTGMLGTYGHGNEPCHHVPYIYNYAGRPDRTAEIVRMIFDRFYLPERDGLCGNDDCGQMSSWYIFSALGFYPVSPVSGKYIFGAPQLKTAVLKLPDGRKFRIRADGISEKALYVKSIRLNGKDMGLHAISYDDINAGGLLEYTMNKTP